MINVIQGESAAGRYATCNDSQAMLNFHPGRADRKPPVWNAQGQAGVRGPAIASQPETRPTPTEDAPQPNSDLFPRNKY
jgi:hypothetical protein